MQPNPQEFYGFAFDGGHFLLHTPSAHLFEVDRSLFEHATGKTADSLKADLLKEKAKEIPIPKKEPFQVAIKAASLNVAQGCNLRCTYCFAGDGDYGQKGMMDRSTAIQTLKDLSRGQERFHIVFFGGEPLLNFKLMQEIVAWCEDSPVKFTFSVTTNGTLLTEKKLEWMRQKGFQITVSYDGDGVQSKQRKTKHVNGGADSETWVKQKLESFAAKLQSLRNMTLRSTVTREFIDDLAPVILKTLSSSEFKLFVSHHASNAKNGALTGQDIEKLEAVYKNVIDNLLSVGDIETLMRFENIKKWVGIIHHGRTNLKACGAGINYLTVSASGEYYLCHRFNGDDTQSCGDYKNGVDYGKLQTIADFRNKKAAPCSDCFMREWCSGGCFYDHKLKNENIFEIDPLYCQLQAVEIRSAMRVYLYLKKNAPEWEAKF